MAQVFATAQVAELLSVSPDTIRTRKSRDSAKFSEGEHFVKRGNETLWTQAGVELLAETLGKEAPFPVVGSPIAPVLVSAVDELAWAYLEQQLPAQIKNRAYQILQHPNAEDLQRLQNIFEQVGLLLDLKAVERAFQAVQSDVKRLEGTA